VSTAVTAVREYNRDLAGNAWNMNLVVSVRLGVKRNRNLSGSSSASGS